MRKPILNSPFSTFIDYYFHPDNLILINLHHTHINDDADDCECVGGRENRIQSNEEYRTSCSSSVPDEGVEPASNLTSFFLPSTIIFIFFLSATWNVPNEVWIGKLQFLIVRNNERTYQLYNSNPMIADERIKTTSYSYRGETLNREHTLFWWDGSRWSCTVVIVAVTIAVKFSS